MNTTRMKIKDHNDETVMILEFTGYSLVSSLQTIARRLLNNPGNIDLTTWTKCEITITRD